MALSVTTKRSVLPVQLDQVKDHLRIGIDDDDVLFKGYIEAATDFIETKCNITLVSTTHTLTCDGWPSDYIELTRGPVTSVTSVKYYTGDVLTTFSSSSYRTDTSLRNAQLRLVDSASWPSHDTRHDAVEVVYVAGATNEATVDARAKLIIKWLVGHWYENREAASDVSLNEMPLGVQIMVQQLTIPAAKATR